MPQKTCPKCGKEQPPENKECTKCGVIFSKIKPVPEPPRKTLKEQPIKPAIWTLYKSIAQRLAKKKPKKQPAKPTKAPVKKNRKPKPVPLNTSLITCPACRKKFSATIDTCIHCGLKLPPEKFAELQTAQQKVESGCMTTFVLVFTLVLVMGYWFSSLDSSNDSKSDREKIIAKAFDGDGSHKELTKIIKATMNDPDSFQHVKSRYSDQGEHIIVQTTFRGKNAFGGVVTNWISAKCSINGHVLEITGQGP